MARPEKPIDWSLFEQLCTLQCIQTEIASCLKISDDTLRSRAIEHYGMDNYSDIYKRFADSGKCSLRRNQFVLSKKNASMAIWLGKIWLGQRDISREAEQVLNSIASQILQHIEPSRELVQIGNDDNNRSFYNTPSTAS